MTLLRWIAIGTLALALAACSTIGIDGVPLDGTQWRAISVGGHPIVGDVVATIKFDGGLASGSAGCNGYSTQQPIRIEGHALELGDTLSTLGRCVDAHGRDAPAMAVEDAFLRILRAADAIAIVNGNLVIGSGVGEIRFVRQ